MIPAMEMGFPLPLPATTRPPRIALHRVLAILAAIVLVGSFAAATPAAGEAPHTRAFRASPGRPVRIGS